MVTDAQKKAQLKYDRNNTHSYIFKFNRVSDADIIFKLDQVSNRQGYIKLLVRSDIRGNGDTISLESIRTLILPFARKYMFDKVFLFGSYARRRATSESDIDLYVHGGTIKTIDDYLSVKNGIEKVTGKTVDLLMDSSIDKESRSGRRLLEHIERDKVLLYESDK